MAKRKTSQAGVDAPESLPPSKQKKLKEEHKKFAALYARHGNATACYLQVYPNSSYEAAKRSASDLLIKPDLLDFIDTIRERDRLAADFTRQEALIILAGMARQGEIDAIESIWEKLGLGKEASKGNWFDGFEQLAGLIRGTEKKE